VSDLFDGYGKLLQGFPDTLNPSFLLTVLCSSEVLVSEAVLQGLKGFLLTSRTFWDSMNHVSGTALQDSDQICGFLLVCAAVVLCYGLKLAPEHSP
jgi:hypothetical protein